MKTKLSRFVIFFFAAVLIVTSATGCRSTAHGAGKDIENMGEKIQDKTD